MITRDVLKVLKLHSPTARAILRTFKTSLVPINHEMHSRSYDFLYLNNKLNYARILIGFHDLLEGRRIDDVTIRNFSLLHDIKRTALIFLCGCLEIDNRRRQDLVRT